MIDKQFDDILRRKLNAMMDTSDSDWSAMEQKLDMDNASNESYQEYNSKGEFDQAIKQKLAGMTTSSTSSDWSSFEQILDQDQLTDQMLDDKVSSEMNNMRAPYRHDHWELLHDNLELRKKRNQDIIGYKIIELSLLFILLLSANNILQHTTKSTFEIEKPKIYASINADDNLIQRDLDNDFSAEASTQILTAEKMVSDETERISIKENQPKIDTQNTSSNAVSSVINNNNIQQKIINTTATSINEQVDIPSVVNSDRSAKVAASNDNSRVMLSSLNTLSKNITPLVYDRDNVFTISNTTPQIIIPHRKTKLKSLTAYLGVDNNLVNSPFDDIYDVEGFRTYGIGYSAGIDFGIAKGKKEWTIGLGYSNRSYEPRIIDELTGDAVVNLFDTSLEHIEFDILSLSAGLRYNLAQNSKWAIDLGIGASANIVAHTNYQIETVSILRDGQFVSSRVNTPYSLDLNNKPLHDGIYEGGSLQENIYLTTDISFGIQRKIGDNTFFSFRPEYSVHSFSNGIGPNNDLINNLSLNLGVRYIL